MLEGESCQVLHDDERLTFMFANVVDGADIRMMQKSGSIVAPTIGKNRRSLLFEASGSRLEERVKTGLFRLDSEQPAEPALRL